MTHLPSPKSPMAGALFGLAMILAPNLASAGDSAAPIQPADPAIVATYGSMPLLASDGTVVTGNAWCDPLTNVCDAHPWYQSHRR